MNAVLKPPPAIRILRPGEACGCVVSYAAAVSGLCARAPREPATEVVMKSRRFMGTDYAGTRVA
jgi:hypothetical protein